MCNDQTPIRVGWENDDVQTVLEHVADSFAELVPNTTDETRQRWKDTYATLLASGELSTVGAMWLRDWVDELVAVK
jgi:hypothetical protein